MSFESFDVSGVSSEGIDSAETPENVIPAEEQVDDNGRPYRTPDGGWVPNNTYGLDGSEYKTDDYGHIYQVDGAYFANDYFVVDGLLYLTDDAGNLMLDDVPGDMQYATDLAELEDAPGDPFATVPEALNGLGEPEWEKLDDSGNPMLGYTNADGAIDWYDKNGVFAPQGIASETSESKDVTKGTPIDGSGGNWSGERGNSTWNPDPDYTPPPKNHTDRPYNNPDNLTWGEILEKYDIDGIEFNDGEPDFTPVAKGEVQIDDFTEDRHGKGGNFDQAAEKLAEQRGCTSDEVKAWMKANNYTWHECSDCKTMQKVPNEIHANVHHDGGVSKAKEANESSSSTGGDV